jgi:hypothetical protein
LGYVGLKQGYPNMTAVPVGLPTPSGTAPVKLRGFSDIYITADSPNKDAVLDFLKFFLNCAPANAYIKGFNTYIPEYNAMMEAKIANAAALKAAHGDDYSANLFTDGFVTISLPLTTRNDYDELNAIISTAVYSEPFEDDLMKIILDEADNYFSGKKSLDDTINIITDRADTYFSEHN